MSRGWNNVFVIQVCCRPASQPESADAENDVTFTSDGQSVFPKERYLEWPSEVKDRRVFRLIGKLKDIIG